MEISGLSDEYYSKTINTNKSKKKKKEPRFLEESETVILKVKFDVTRDHPEHFRIRF